MSADTVLPDTWIQLVAVFVIVLGPTLTSVIVRRGDKKDTEATETDKKDQAMFDVLIGKVNAQGALITELQEEMKRLTTEIDENKAKLMAWAERERDWRKNAPDLTMKIYIPPIIKDDLA